MPTRTETEIQQLDSLRKQIFWWRTGATLVVAVTVVGCLFALNSSVRGLAEPGPKQDEFVGYVSQAMQKDIMPNIQTLASQTLTEIQPQIREEFQRLNTRVPELTQATVKEMQILQDELPKSSEKTFDDAFGNLLASRESKIREMYPDVTEAQVDAFMKNLKSTGETQIRAANDELFSSHQAALSSILDHMQTLSSSTAADVKGQDPTWEMGLAVLDVVRDDLKASKPDATESSTTGKDSATNSAGDKKEAKS